MYEEKEIKYKKRKPNRFYNEKIKTINMPSFFTKINWKQLFIKISILIIVMALIIFIISRINKNTQEKNLVINNNLDKIVNASLQYYKSDELPKNIGDATSILLAEMISKNLIEELKDKEDNICSSVNSYIIITKSNENEYSLKVNLSCPKEEKNIEKTLICSDKCELKK